MTEEKPPLLFRRTLGGLVPANDAAEEALNTFELGSVAKVKVVRTRGNQARMALYWIVLAKAADALSDRVEGDPLDSEMLHRVLKDRKGLYTKATLPSGDEVKNYKSVSFTTMPENERVVFIDWAFRTLAKWLGCTVLELTQE
jgi:hypothetical protein